MKKLVIFLISSLVFASCGVKSAEISYEKQRYPQVVFMEGRQTSEPLIANNALQARTELDKYLAFIVDKNFVYNDIIEEDPIVSLLNSDTCQSTYYCKVYDGYILEAYFFMEDSQEMLFYSVYDFGNYRTYSYNSPEFPHYPSYIFDFKGNWLNNFGCQFTYDSDTHSGVVYSGMKCDNMFINAKEFWLKKAYILSYITNREADLIKENNTIDKDLIDRYLDKLIEYIDSNYHQ
ncbi:hypothetical protein SDC9_109866 [bioreactor metagenome]|uniref:Lipoprotein n=1 Tax=bioreactor metagenome TaxID=1076179 RepID=A0A645BD58_9ZZZZ